MEDPLLEIELPGVIFTRPTLLLHPNIPKPLHGLAPRILLGDKWWDEKRRKAYGLNNYHCFACGTYHPYNLDRQRFETIKLHAHECYTIDYEKKTMELKEIVALCGDLCHNYVHSGRMNALYNNFKSSGLRTPLTSGKQMFDEQDCWTIVTHGDSVLIDGGLLPNHEVDCRDYSEEWSEWRLIIDGVGYKSKFNNIEEWKEHYS